MAEQILGQHTPRRRASIERLLGEVPENELEFVMEELARWGPENHRVLLHDALYNPVEISPPPSPAHHPPPPPPAMPRRRAVPSLLVISLVGLVLAGWAAMTGLAAMKDWALEGIDKLLPLPPLPPLPAAYNYGAKLEETLRRGEEAMAAAMNPLPELERLYRQGEQLELSLDAVTRDYLRLWDVFHTENQTVLDHHKQLQAVINYASDPLQKGLAEMQRKLVSVIGWASEEVNTTVEHVSRVLNVSDDEIVRIWGPRQPRLGLVQAFLYRLRTQPSHDNITPDPQLIRDRTVWKTVCDSQAYLLRLNKRLLKKGLQVTELVKTNQKDFKPVQDYIIKEVDNRMRIADTMILNVYQRFNTSMQEWGALRANRWRDSSNLWISALGWLLQGQKPPVWPHYDLEPPSKTMDDLESAEGQLAITVAIMSSIIRHSRNQIHLADVSDATTDPDDDDAEHPCSLLLANTYNSMHAIRSSRKSLLEMVHILDEQVTAFKEQLLKLDGEQTWDDEAFQNDVTQAREKMNRNRSTTKTSNPSSL